jgi:hypothetical protein
MPFNNAFVQRIQLRQPQDEALQFFAARNDALLNIVELALDWVFDYYDALDEAFDFVCRHHVKQHHGSQGVRFYPGKNGVSRYTGPRTAPNVLAVYADKVCRVTGERYCVHLDWRIRGVPALTAAQIKSVADLLDFDHHAFWSKRLILAEIDERHLGRLLNNPKRRLPWLTRSRSGRVYDYDLRHGSTVVHVSGSVQAVIDNCRHRVRVRNCLRRFDVSHLLPEPPQPVSAPMIMII